MEYTKDKNDAFAAQQKLSIIQLIWELPNWIWLLLSAFFSKSILVWVDVFDSTNVLCRSIFVMFLSGKLKKNLSFQYNYGTGKVEAIASLCCDVLLLVSLLIAIVFSIREFIYPQQPSGLLIWVLLVKVENIIFDMYILHKQQKNKVKSKLYKAERASNVKNAVFDVALFIILLITFALRDLPWSWYIMPSCSIALALIFSFYTISRMNEAIRELMDATCDEQTQQNIIKVLVAMYDQYDEFIEVKSRQSSDQLLIDIYVRFLPETNYTQIEQFAKIAAEKMRELNPNSVVSLVIQED